MKVLITGATGFVGANLFEHMIAGNETHLVVRESSDTWRIDNLKKEAAGVWPAELSDREAVFTLMAQVKPQVVFHVATYGGLPFQSDKNRMIDANLRGTVNLIDAAVENGVQVFLNTGSSSEYGVKDHPMREDEICEPVNFYGVTKLAATNYCTMIGKGLGFKVCTLRLFSPFGKYEDPSRLYPSIISALGNDERPKLGNPDSVRDFIEIEKVVSVYSQLAGAEFPPGAVFNVGSGRQQTIREFCLAIAARLGKDGLEPVWGAAASRKSEPRVWEADMTRLRQVLGPALDGRR